MSRDRAVREAQSMGVASSSSMRVRTPSPKVTVSTSAHKLLAKALKVCAKKPKKQRASCVKQAHKKYGTTATKAKKS
jgi:hypothetical protein